MAPPEAGVEGGAAMQRAIVLHDHAIAGLKLEHQFQRRPLLVDGIEVLPAGARIAGFVSEAQRSGRVKGRARIAFRFTSLVHDGERYSLWFRGEDGRRHLCE